MHFHGNQLIVHEVYDIHEVYVSRVAIAGLIIFLYIQMSVAVSCIIGINGYRVVSFGIYASSIDELSVEY